MTVKVKLKDVVDHLEMLGDAALERIAIDWLDENGIDHVIDDVETSKGSVDRRP